MFYIEFSKDGLGVVVEFLNGLVDVFVEGFGVSLLVEFVIDWFDFK